MKTLKDNNKNEIIIKNSRFICLLYKLDNVNNIDIILNNIKTEYKDATHYCYAYIFDNTYKSNDDGEPGGTAGMPILNVLKNNNLNYILAIVVRYFGGIKLGAGGLVRAYTKSVTETIKKSTITTLLDGYNLIIEFDYDKIKEIDYLLKDSNVNSKTFDNKIIYDIDIDKNIYKTLKNYNYINIKKETNKKIFY